MDEDTVVKLVTNAAADVFSTMLGLSIETGEPFHQGATADAEGVIALIGLAGSWIGTGMLKCSPEFACKISSLMLMADYESVNGDVLDAIGEISNMIFGNVKTELEDLVGPLGLSIPTVLFGRNFSAKSLGCQTWTVVPVRYGPHQMEVKICLTPSHNCASAQLPGYLRPCASLGS